MLLMIDWILILFLTLQKSLGAACVEKTLPKPSQEG